MTSRSSAGAAGFTLIELLIVLAIMAAAATLVAVRAGAGRNGAELRAATREMAAALEETRSVAIAGNRATALVIDSDTGRYRSLQRAHRLPDQLTLVLRQAVPTTRDGTTGAIYFFPDGSSSGGEIELAAGSLHQAVGVDWFTGRTSIHAIPAPR